MAEPTVNLDTAAAEACGYARAVKTLKDMPHDMAEHRYLWRFVRYLEEHADATTKSEET